MYRFKLEQRLDLLKLYENIVKNLVAEKDQHCPVYPSLFLNFGKLDSLLVHQDVRRARTVRLPKNSEAVVESVHGNSPGSVRHRF